MAGAQLNVTRHGGAVRLTMSARVANDLGSLQKGLRSLAERLGHPTCASGCDILHLTTEQEFAIGEKVELNPQPLPPRASIVDLSNPMPARTVLVSIPRKVNNDISALTRAVGVVVGKLGCSGCCSGFDILFRQELDMIHIDEKLNAQGFGSFH